MLASLGQEVSSLRLGPVVLLGAGLSLSGSIISRIGIYRLPLGPSWDESFLFHSPSYEKSGDRIHWISLPPPNRLLADRARTACLRLDPTRARPGPPRSIPSAGSGAADPAIPHPRPSPARRATFTHPPSRSIYIGLDIISDLTRHGVRRPRAQPPNGHETISPPRRRPSDSARARGAGGPWWWTSRS